MKKSHITLIFLLFLSIETFAHSEIRNSTVKNGIGLGSVIAIVISWSRNKSVLLAILHGLLGWLYVIYYSINLKNQ